MERITRADVDRIAQTVSDKLPAGYRLQVQGRNGYFGLDRYKGDVMLDVVRTGTKRDLYTYLQGMRAAQLLADLPNHV